MKHLLGIYRENEFSPGRHKSNDARLLQLVSDRLRERGCVVDLITIDHLPGDLSDFAIVFSMCQGRASLETLARHERAGLSIVNRPSAAIHTYRSYLPKYMAEAGVAFPATTLVALENGAKAEIDVNGGVWLKRGDVHASVAADVQWIDSAAGLEAGFAEFASRGIRTAAVQPHHAGDEVKFYGVGENKFFHWFYSSEPHGYPFNVRALGELAARAAAAAGLEIFGGDIIVSPSGELTVIDLNDWPSFAPCIGPASEAIADFLATRSRDH
jgi:hypothetical protein